MGQANDGSRVQTDHLIQAVDIGVAQRRWRPHSRIVHEQGDRGVRAQHFLDSSEVRRLVQIGRDDPNRAACLIGQATCHAIELSLKAFLVLNGTSSAELRGKRIRHSLAGLLAQAASKGLSISLVSRSEIELLDEAQEKFWPRYPREWDGAKPVFVIDYFEPYAEEILQMVATEMYPPV